MSILNLAKKATSAAGRFAWQGSGASSIPILEGARKLAFKNASGINSIVAAKRTAPEIQAGPIGSADPAMMERMARLRAIKAEKSASGKESSVDKNREAHERALQGSKFFRNSAMPGAGGAGGLDPESAENIKKIRELTEKLLEKAGEGAGGLIGGLAGLLGGGLKGALGKIASKIPGVGKLAQLGGRMRGGLAAGAALGAAKFGGLMSKIPAMAGGALRSGIGLASNAPGMIGKVARGAAGLATMLAMIAGLKGKGAGLLNAVKGTGTGLLDAAKVKGVSALNVAKEKGATALSAVKGKGAELASAGLAKGAGIVGTLGKVASKVPGVLAAGGGLAAAAGGGLLGLAKSKGAAALETGKSLMSKVSGSGAAKAAGGMAGKIGLKQVIKNVPILGLLARTGFAVKRAMDGDWTGAGMEVAAGVASTFPGVGTAAALGIDGAMIARDQGVFGDKPGEKKAEGEVTAAAGTAATAAQKIADPAIKRAVLKTGDSEPVNSGLANLQAFVTAAMDEEKGIYVRMAKSPFDKESMFKSESGEQAPTTNKPRMQPENMPQQTPGTVTSRRRSNADIQAYTNEPKLQSAETAPTGRRRSNVPVTKNESAGGGRGTQGVAAAKTAAIPKGAGKGFDGFGDDVDGHIAEASGKYGISEDVLRGFVKMEAGWKGDMSPTGAIGTGQFIQSTWDGLSATEEGKEIGMSKIGNRFRKEDDPRRDKKTNTMATGLLAKKNADMLKKNGIEPTGENLYMMHNIGPGVIQAMKGKEVSPATLKAMQQNGMKPGQTSGEFLEMQKGRFNSHYKQANAPEVLEKSKNSGLSGQTLMAAETPKAEPMLTKAAAATPTVTAPATPSRKERLSGSEATTSISIAKVSDRAKEAERQRSAGPVIMPAPAEPVREKSSPAVSESQGHMATRNGDSSIRRLTDAKMTYGMV